MINFKSLSCVVLFLHTIALGQFSNIIPAGRRVDWSRVGVEGGITRTVHFEVNFQTLKNANPGMTDLQLFLLAVSQVNSFKSSNPGKWTSIYFPAGVYNFVGYLNLGIQDSNLVIRGAGANSTFLDFALSNGHLFTVAGSSQSGFVSLDATYGFSKGSKFIKTLSPIVDVANGDWIELVVSNGPWHGNYDGGNSSEWNPQDYVGQMVRVKSVSSNNTVFELYDELRRNYEANLNPRIRKVIPARNIGFENFTITSSGATDNGSHNFLFSYSVNCWIWGVESYRPSQAHVAIGTSSHIEVRGSWFHHAKSYGSGGRGYGISIGSHSTNCLIEDNVFNHLRHAMILSTGANGNVFGYNLSRDQVDDNFYYSEADMSIHGHFAFANLFEGNDVIYGVADDYWGTNGPYNTYFRNWIETSVWLETMDYANALGNEFAFYEGGFNYNGGGNPGDINQNHGSWNVLDIYGIFLGGSGYGQPTHHQAMFSTLIWLNSVLNDISLYRVSRPSFISSAYTWPPMGPAFNYDPNTNTAYETTQYTPAYDRWYGSVKTVAAPPLVFPISVSISGPSTVYHADPKGTPANCETWTANVTGGAPPYSYQWSQFAYGANSTFTNCFSWNGYQGGTYEFTIRVDITDSQNNTTFATKSVTAYNSGGGPIAESPEGIHPEIAIPEEFGIQQNYPNPFNPETEISFGLPEPSSVKVVVLDILGRELSVLSDQDHAAGYHRLIWNGKDDTGKQLSSGVYFLRMTAVGISGKEFAKVLKMALTK